MCIYTRLVLGALHHRGSVTIPDYHTHCMMISLITSSATISRDARLNHSSSQSLLDDIWSSHTLLDDSIHLKRWIIISIITIIAWWYPSTQYRMIITIHHKHCMMKPFITSLAWWYLLSQTLHKETCPIQRFMKERIDTQGLLRTTEDNREGSLS